ncbi:MAG: hypothetical protein AAFU55_03730 [Pseudomonadota bacterium]
MKDHISDEGAGRGDGERERLDALYERLTVLVLKRREIDVETSEIWEEINDLESRL